MKSALVSGTGLMNEGLDSQAKLKINMHSMHLDKLRFKSEQIEKS